MTTIPTWWAFFASAGMSLLIGFGAVSVLAYYKRLTDPAQWVSAGVLAITLYTLAVLLVGHWGFKIDVAHSIKDGFSSDRFAWLMIAFAFDGLGRFYINFIAPDRTAAR